jgi:hypothetical protein
MMISLRPFSGFILMLYGPALEEGLTKFDSLAIFASWWQCEE